MLPALDDQSSLNSSDELIRTLEGDDDVTSQGDKAVPNVGPGGNRNSVPNVGSAENRAAVPNVAQKSESFVQDLMNQNPEVFGVASGGVKDDTTEGKEFIFLIISRIFTIIFNLGLTFNIVFSLF